MNGLAARAMQRFVTDTYGEALWRRVIGEARLSVSAFEVMLCYPEDYAPRIVAAAATVFGRPQADFLEDLGTWLVADERNVPIRRLLRYGGADFTAFLESLDDLPDRIRLAMPGMVLPRLRARTLAPDLYSVTCSGSPPGVAHVLVGLIRAMADEYGALAIIEVEDDEEGGARDPAPLAEAVRLSVSVPSARYFEGRDFHLGGGTR